MGVINYSAALVLALLVLAAGLALAWPSAAGSFSALGLLVLALLALGLSPDRAKDRLQVVASEGGEADVNGWVRRALSHGN